MGPEELLVAAKIELDPDLAFAEVAATVDATEAAIREAVPIARVVYLEPDVFAPERSPGAPTAGSPVAPSGDDAHPR
jgi:hypothetical protein